MFSSNVFYLAFDKVDKDDFKRINGLEIFVIIGKL
jgi:hypothetical protein